MAFKDSSSPLPSPTTSSSASIKLQEKVTKLLQRCKNTQQSIQSTTRWMLDHAPYLDKMVHIWYELITSESTDSSHQIVLLYVANDVIQVGARSRGKAISDAFETKLLEAAQFIMTREEDPYRLLEGKAPRRHTSFEKVKRCLIKIVGIWKARAVISPEPMAILQHICAGKDPTELLNAQLEKPIGDTDFGREQSEFLDNLLGEKSMEMALEDMPEVQDSEMTSIISQKIQNLVSATITSDLLSDRVFQLESCISNFHHAMEAFDGVNREEDAALSQAGIAWDLVEQQVYDLDIEKSRDHVQQYRDNLEQQSMKREELLQQISKLLAFDVKTQHLNLQMTQVEMDREFHGLEQLYSVCLKAMEMDEKKQLERKQAALRKNLARPRQNSATQHARYTPDPMPARRHSSLEMHSGDRYAKRPRMVESPHGRQPRWEDRRHESPGYVYTDRPPASRWDHNRDHNRDRDGYP
uniref:Uncharacterized protein AlNc14C5G786 n=1 Tax=Albugo laibachii Nc14 TaxID=890382 RepID=F0W106_9STRA|nr:conserved hypothetical protein [Albugo laibachii Nc14]|eukprot:CCA14730.1 conserved hypothetical protein [Albugo laibachii Nc14]